MIHNVVKFWTSAVGIQDLEVFRGFIMIRLCFDAWMIILRELSLSMIEVTCCKGSPSSDDHQGSYGQLYMRFRLRPP